MSAMLSLSAVSKSYGRTRALQSVGFAADAGEFVPLLGPNGAGKSTLVQILTGLFAPDNGSVQVCGLDLRRHAVEALRQLGIVFQQQTLDLELSAAANLRFHADLHGLERATARHRIGEALDRFGLAGRADEPARQLSGGNRRRLELARALLHRPRVLIMDEPTVGLDPQSRRDILAHVRALAGTGEILALWATHLVDEAEDARRLILLDRGRVAFDGAPAALLAECGAATLGDAFLAVTGGTPDDPAAPPQH